MYDILRIAVGIVFGSISLFFLMWMIGVPPLRKFYCKIGMHSFQPKLKFTDRDCVEVCKWCDKITHYIY